MVELGGAVDAGEVMVGSSNSPTSYCLTLYCTLLHCTVLYCTVVWCGRTAPAGVRGDHAGRLLHLPAAARDQGPDSGGHGDAVLGTTSSF